ncbi:MAG TPA: bifunctional nuclease family protein [Burkholderiales bacterium]|nr:bifunctional nuclease family protein [Burkholderiales bacterium]
MTWSRILALVALLACAPACGADIDAGLVRIEQTEVALTPMGHVVLLTAQGKAIPIFVDGIVAQSIHGALTGEKYPRPLTHELMRSVLEGFDGRVTRVVITLKGATYYGDLTVVVRGASKVFDSRSSDAIALAAHFKAPVLVSRELLDKFGQSLEQPVKSKPGETRL